MVETQRLKIIPLTYRDLTNFIRTDNILEDEMGLKRNPRTITGELKDMVETYTLPALKRAGKDGYLFFTFWIAVDKVNNSLVAELGFKGQPNYKGEIEIGYDTMPEQRGKGYMTEAVGGLVGWASRQNRVHRILAETHKENFASIRVVEKNGFTQFDKRNDMLWWRRDLDKISEDIPVRL